jgi:hypothetical protein
VNKVAGFGYDILLPMADINSRIQKFVGQMTGNEALLDMLDADAASEMQKWGVATVTALVKETEGMDDATAEQILEPKLKAVRQAMRSGGNWAAGKYADAASRASLQAKLAEYRSVIFGEPAKLLPDTALVSMLDPADDRGKSPLQLVQSFKRIMK